MFCTNCGRESDDQAQFCQACGTALKSLGREPGIQQVMTTTTAVKYAGFWRRLAASLIDGTLICIVYFPFVLGSLLVIFLSGGVAPNLVGPVTHFFLGLLFLGGPPSSEWLTGRVVGGVIFGVGTWIYYSVMQSSSKQATLGKMACGIIVTDLNGKRLSFGHAVKRELAKFISALTLFVGYFMAGFTKKKQALHDIITGCLVVKI